MPKLQVVLTIDNTQAFSNLALLAGRTLEMSRARLVVAWCQCRDGGSLVVNVEASILLTTMLPLAVCGLYKPRPGTVDMDITIDGSMSCDVTLNTQSE